MAILVVDEFNDSKKNIINYINEIDKISNNIKTSFIKINNSYNTNNKSNMEKMDDLLYKSIDKMKKNYNDYVLVMSKNIDTYKSMEVRVGSTFENIGRD